MFLFIPMRLVLLGETKGFMNAVGTIYLGVMINVYALSYCAYLVNLEPNPNAGYLGMIIYLLFTLYAGNSAGFSPSFSAFFITCVYDFTYINCDFTSMYFHLNSFSSLFLALSSRCISMAR